MKRLMAPRPSRDLRSKVIQCNVALDAGLPFTSVEQTAAVSPQLALNDRHDRPCAMPRSAQSGPAEHSIDPASGPADDRREGSASMEVGDR